MENQRGEDETELSWDHEGLEPYPCPERPKPQRRPKEKGTPMENGKRGKTLKKDPKGRESQEKEKPTSLKLDETAPKELKRGQI